MNMNSKSCSLDPIPAWLVKSSFNELKMAMLYIVNRSLVIENTFPETLKHAIVTLSLKDKDGDSEDYYNYRPISNTAFLSKMIEKIALSQINCHIEKYNLHARQQSGYRKNHSCETARVKTIDDMQRMKEGNLVAIILLDLSAAFDTVDHKILIDRLKADFGITGGVLKWINSHLGNRTFSVKIRNAYSHKITLLFGVRQGSLLGPILFILYTKEVTIITEKYGLKVQVYADGHQLYIGSKNDDDRDIQITTDLVHCCLQEIKR